MSDLFDLSPPTSNQFDIWWAQYPLKIKKKQAKQIWSRCKLDAIADKIIADTMQRPQTSQWQRGYIPHPTTYLNGERWADETIPEQTYEQRIRHQESPIERINRQARAALEQGRPPAF